MLTLPGYHIIEVIHAEAKTIVYRGRRIRDEQPVILKLPKAEYPSLPEMARLRREYELIKDLALAGIISPYGLEEYDHGLALILEDFGGLPLHRTLIFGRLELATFLNLAVQLADILGQLHQRHLIHQDIKPANILFNPTTDQVKLTDFSLASRLSRENQKISSPHLLEGTLAYMSPEQTGRMNRAIDYRTDFYSLGVTLYELLTGQLPFPTTDPMEMVHAHIAKQPLPPHELNPHVPRPISDIVLKLLAKTAEDRYQSAFGLKADLEACRAQWQTHHKIENFELGQHDISDQFLIPQKLYGRKQEIELLLAAFERVSGSDDSRGAREQGTRSGGEISRWEPATSSEIVNRKSEIPKGHDVVNPPEASKIELLLVSGYAGIGKSALVNEVHKPIVRQKGYFVGGKFDQFQRNIPYGAVIQAFQELVRQLLTESEAQIEAWKDKLCQALGANGQVIIEVMPEVELIIGPQPPVPELLPAEAQNRFNLVFEHFIQVFTRKEHPLVLFLDDLQWADSATLTLLPTLLTHPGMSHLLVIGAYRDNEVSEAHPLALTLADLARAGASLSSITLKPLAMTHLNQFIADTLKCDLDRSRPLAELVLHKTAGNPFFVIQFLKSLYQERLLEFEAGSGQWRFDLAQIQRAGMTDNVVTLMAGKIQKLPERTQRLTQMAACIGNRFDLNTLAIVNEQSPGQTAAELWQAVQEGLILPVGAAYEFAPEDAPETLYQAAYEFLHDRVQQAAYALIPDDQKRAVHLQVGQLMLQHSSAEEREENLFDIVNHLNLGAELITDPAARTELARLNLAAGRKAKSSTAYQPALSYFKAGLGLLGAAGWTAHYDLTFSLYRELAEGEYLCGNFAEAEQAFDLLLSQARSKLEKAEIYSLRIIQYENMAKYTEAVQAGQKGLRLFGLGLPETGEAKQAAFAAEMQLIQAGLGEKSIEELIHLPVMADQATKMSMKLLMTMWAPAYIAGDSVLTILISATMVRLSLAYGNSEESAYAYVIHGITVGSGLGDFKSGYEFGRLALKVNEQFHDRKLRAKVQHMFSCFVNLWRMPLKTCFPYAKEAYRAALEVGDFVYATYGIFHESWYGLLCGQDLSRFQADYRPNLTFLTQIKNHSFIDAQQVILHWGLNLQGLTAGKFSFNDTSFDEKTYLDAYKDDPFFETFYFVTKIASLYTFENYGEARAIAQKAEGVVPSLAGTIWQVLLCFYHGLTLAALYPAAARKTQRDYGQKLNELCAQMEFWADNCPENFRHPFLLLAAERAKIKGRPEQAMALYEQAIRSARENGFRQNEALANELYARFWLERGNEKIAQLYLAEARFGYEQWGALAKVKDLEERYPALLAHLPPTALTPTASPSSTGGTTTATLDLMAVMKAAQAISGEIVQETLLEKLMQIVIENAGAQRGFLLLEKQGRLGLAAGGVSEAEARAGVTLLPSVPVETRNDLSPTIINYVNRTGESLVIANAAEDSCFANDPYIAHSQPRSILCTPILSQGKLTGILYLENNLIPAAFTADRIELIQILSAQAAISLENARLYAEMKQEMAERRRAEESLRQAHAELEQRVAERTAELVEANRRLQQEITERQQLIEELDAFAHTVAHDLQNPLSIIVAYNELLQASWASKAERQRAVQVIAQNGHRMSKIVRELLLLARMRQTEVVMQPLDMAKIVHEAQQRLIFMIEDKQAEIILPDSWPAALGYAPWIEEVWANYIGNALKYGGQPPRVELGATVQAEGPVRFWVKDNGNGLSPEDQARLFTPFTRLNQARVEGYGLGLSIVQRIVEKLGGQVGVESEGLPGCGCTFYFTLPGVTG
ncbi:MAG: ATP-binding sensor histidine kinase [Chloroflexota bacterium]